MHYSLLNLFGLGKIRFSASIAAALALPVFVLLNYSADQPLLLHLLFFFGFLCVTIQQLRKYAFYAKSDPKEIVIDEFLGMYICLIIGQTINIYWLILEFVLFRILDILKPFPFSWIENKIKDEIGIIADDLIIGIVLGTLTQLVM
jgi:phosphatidylglycerophosphatase A